MMTRKPTSPSSRKNSQAREAAPVTFLEHTKELQVRLFIVLIAFLLIAGAAWPFFDVIANVLTGPLGENHELFYLTPGGAFAFIMQVCIYVGLIGALPVIIYQVYRFAMPAVKKTTFWKAVGFTIVSLILALGGIAFGYIVLLPAALEFLTGFSFNDINPMLTIDSYMSFVMTYLLASALLFQLPLIMIIIDSIKPQTPKGLMKQQGKILLGSFIVAAIISPTPDALNQTILASPIVVMYQIGIMIIWVRHKKRLRLAKRALVATAIVENEPTTAPQPAFVADQTVDAQRQGPVGHLAPQGATGALRSAIPINKQVTHRAPAVPVRQSMPHVTTSIDGMRREGAVVMRPMAAPRTRPNPVTPRPLRPEISATRRNIMPSRNPPRTIDGFALPV